LTQRPATLVGDILPPAWPNPAGGPGHGRSLWLHHLPSWM